MTLRPFHYAFIVDDLDAARGFYRDVIGCGEGRSSDEWIDFDMFGHQVVAHLLSGSDDRRTGPLPSFSERPGDVQDFGPTSQPDYPVGSREGERAGAATAGRRTNQVDGDDVPVPHFGVVLTVADFAALAERFAAAKIAFVIPPTVRFAGQAGEQHTMFVRDPAGNALEFKAFADDAALFAVDGG